MHRSKAAVVVIFVTILFSTSLFAQSVLPAKWEELTGPDFIQAIQKAQGTCMLPFGISREAWSAIAAGHRSH